MAIFNEKNKTLLESESVKEFVSRKPDFLIRYSTGLFFFLLIIIFTTCWFIQYPDIVSVPAKLISSNSSNHAICQIKGKNNQYYLQVNIPKIYSQKVKSGQPVTIKFQSSPYNSYGSVNGSLSCLTNKTNDSNCIAEVDLPKGLKTDHFKQIPFENGLVGIAQIKTGNVRLIKRVFLSMFKRFKKSSD